MTIGEKTMSEAKKHELPYIRPAEPFGSRRNMAADVGVQRTRSPTREAMLAFQLVERWGMITVKPSTGEDSSGLAKLDLMSPQEVVDRAFETASLAFKEMENRDWFVDIPTMEEGAEILKERENKREMS